MFGPFRILRCFQRNGQLVSQTYLAIDQGSYCCHDRKLPDRIIVETLHEPSRRTGQGLTKLGFKHQQARRETEIRGNPGVRKWSTSTSTTGVSASSHPLTSLLLMLRAAFFTLAFQLPEPVTDTKSIIPVRIFVRTSRHKSSALQYDCCTFCISPQNCYNRYSVTGALLSGKNDSTPDHSNCSPSLFLAKLI